MLWGAIIGDICGSTYEGWPPQGEVTLFKDGSTFTDDTVCTCAIANALLTDESYEKSLRDICSKYPKRGYGQGFTNWLNQINIPYGNNSYGNGAIMRVSPTAWISEDIDEVLKAAEESAKPSHGHPEGIKGARAIAHSIFWARKGMQKDSILNNLELNYGYPLFDESLILEENDFIPTCQQSIPIVMTAFNEGNSFEECVINAIRYGYDTDTNAAVVGAIAEAYYGIDQWMIDKAKTYLTSDLLWIINSFEKKFS